MRQKIASTATRRGRRVTGGLRRRETRLTRIKKPESLGATSAGQGRGGKAERRRSKSGGQGSIQLHRPGVAHHEGADVSCRATCASGGGADYC